MSTIVITGVITKQSEALELFKAFFFNLSDNQRKRQKDLEDEVEKSIEEVDLNKSVPYFNSWSLTFQDMVDGHKERISLHNWRIWHYIIYFDFAPEILHELKNLFSIQIHTSGPTYSNDYMCIPFDRRPGVPKFSTIVRFNPVRTFISY